MLRAEGLLPARTDAAADGAAGGGVVLTEADTARARARLAEILRGFLLAAGAPLKVLRVVEARVTSHTEAAWKSQLKELGVSIADVRAPDLLHLRAVWRHHNLALIRTLAEEKVARVRTVLEESPGSRVEDLAERIRAQTGTTRSHAELLARDQTLKLNGEIAQARHKAAGVTEYVWRTSRDERVRSRHKTLEGSRHKYTEPPVVDEKTGRRAHPGGDYQCRCTADPVLPGLEDITGP
jgi:SPP1 gp7 family putative phage head morphogenesis protein